MSRFLIIFTRRVKNNAHLGCCFLKLQYCNFVPCLCIFMKITFKNIKCSNLNSFQNFKIFLEKLLSKPFFQRKKYYNFYSFENCDSQEHSIFIRIAWQIFRPQLSRLFSGKKVFRKKGNVIHKNEKNCDSYFWNWLSDQLLWLHHSTLSFSP